MFIALLLKAVHENFLFCSVQIFFQPNQKLFLIYYFPRLKLKQKINEAVLDTRS